MADYSEVCILNNFYQTSSFYPMPIVLISTYSESGQINLAPYSLIFPHYALGTNEWSMMLICRGSSNTAQNIMRDKRCCLNYIPHSKAFMENCVLLGYPGETTEQKMKENNFTLIPSSSCPGRESAQMPDYVAEAIQIFECEWDSSYPTKHNKDLEETHLLLRLKRIVMKDEWKDKLYEGREFPILPINFGFRDNINFWFSSHSKPYKIPVPASKGNSIETVMYACERVDPDVKWEKAACEMLLLVPPIFLKDAATGCVEEAKAAGLSVITPAFMEKIRDKRARETEKKTVEFTLEWDHDAMDSMGGVPKDILEMVVGNTEKWCRDHNYPRVTLNSIRELMESLGMDLDEMLALAAEMEEDE